MKCTKNTPYLSLQGYLWTVYLWNITTLSGNVIVYTWNTYHTQWWATVKTPSPLSSPNQQTSGSSRDDRETMILKPCALVYTHPSMALCACGVIIVYTDRVVSFACIQQLRVSCKITLRGHYSTVYSDADQGKHESSASLAFVWGNHRGPVYVSLWRRHHEIRGNVVIMQSKRAKWQRNCLWAIVQCKRYQFTSFLKFYSPDFNIYTYFVAICNIRKGPN